MAVAALFFGNGALFGNVVPRYPQIKSDLGLSNSSLGSAIAAFSLGALALGLLAAPLVARYRSARVAVTAMAFLGGGVATIALAPNWLALAGVMFVCGGVDAIMDVAQNAHGLRVQYVYGRSVVNSFHGAWSIGSVTGGLMGAAAAGLRIPLVTHLAGVGALFALVGLVSYRALLGGHDALERDAEAAESGAPVPRALHGLTHVRRASVKLLLVLGVLAACGAVVEDAGASWSALYLRNELGTAAAAAGLAFVVFQTGMTIGRLSGDRLADRFGRRRVVQTGGALVAAGMGAALAVPSVASTMAGYAVAGLGVATLVPATMHTADELPGLPPGVGLTVVSWLLRAGFFMAPPIVGAIADAVGLRLGLLSAVIAGVVVVVLGRVFVGGLHAGLSRRS